jgi:hypothetical protein
MDGSTLLVIAMVAMMVLGTLFGGWRLLVHRRKRSPGGD